MKKWAMIGGGLMLLAWAPFLYAELTSSPAEKKGRDLPADEPIAVEAEPTAGAVAAVEPSAEPEPAAAERPAPAAAPAAAKDPEEPQPGAPGAKAAPAAEGKADPAHPAEADPGEADEAEQEEPPPPPPTAEGPTDVLKKAYETQPRDALWAKDAEARIGALFGTADVPAEMLQSATCRKAVCRVEVRWTREHATAFVTMFQAAGHQGFGSDVGIEPIGAADEEDGHQQVDLYLPRKGYTVADLSK